MSNHVFRALPRLHPLAAGIAALWALTAHSAFATTFVTNCNDSGAGSLRAAVAGATNNDTVDASGLLGVCSKITLKTGAIPIGVGNLTVVGPGAALLDVTALYDNGAGSTHQYQNRIFTHTASGTLTLRNLELSNGLATDATEPRGGCVRSHGSVVLDHADIDACEAKTSSAYAQGGGIYAVNVTANYSTIRNNRTDGGTSAASNGGGVLAANAFIAHYSSVVNNLSTNTAGTDGIGAGVRAMGSVSISNSTFSGNVAGDSFGALSAENPGSTTLIANSTISGNTATNGIAGGIYSTATHTKIYSSTIAFNTAKLGTSGVGAKLYTGLGGDVKLESNIIAANTYGVSAADNDFNAQTPTLTGHNNLIRVSVTSLPNDTIAGKCPLLAPLADNGGLTKTHRPYGHSPAIDAGNNAFAASDDQRGSAAINGVRNFSRVSGPPGGAAIADIGAYEIDQADEIFDSSFEGCP